MAEVLVWRIEKADNMERGPYGACFFGAEHNDPNTHPSPYRDKALERDTDYRWQRGDDGYLHIRTEEFCGTASLRELAGWFAGYGSVLAEKGYRVVALAVDESKVRRGRRQLVFERREARLINSMSPAIHISTKEGVTYG